MFLYACGGQWCKGINVGGFMGHIKDKKFLHKILKIVTIMVVTKTNVCKRLQEAAV